ncbi:hypothetical protein AQY21_11350 [Paracoccus sp. MKU1]|nr:hypothetical protein AQY21_11350 [Paracoccus sp. MKU1]
MLRKKGVLSEKLGSDTAASEVDFRMQAYVAAQEPAEADCISIEIGDGLHIPERIEIKRIDGIFIIQMSQFTIRTI